MYYIIILLDLTLLSRYTQGLCLFKLCIQRLISNQFIIILTNVYVPKFTIYIYYFCFMPYAKVDMLLVITFSKKLETFSVSNRDVCIV